MRSTLQATHNNSQPRPAVDYGSTLRDWKGHANVSIDVNALDNDELVALETRLQHEEQGVEAIKDQYETLRRTDPTNLHALRMESEAWSRLADISMTLTDIHIRLIIRGVRLQGDPPPKHI